jgi:hypothetical protein
MAHAITIVLVFIASHSPVYIYILLSKTVSDSRHPQRCLASFLQPCCFFCGARPVPRSAINLVYKTVMPSEPVGPMLRSWPPRSSSVGGSGSSLRQGGQISGSPSRGGTNLTKKPLKPKKVMTHDKHSSSSGPLPRSLLPRLIRSGPIRSLELRSPPLASTRWWHQTRFPPLTEVGFPGGIPWFLSWNHQSAKPLGFRPGIPHFLGRLSPPRSRWLPLRWAPARRCVGCPLGDWRCPGSTHPDPPSGGPSLTHVSGMGGGKLLFTPLAAGTLADHPFPAPSPPGFGQVVLPDFASLLCSVSPDLVEPSPGAPRWEPGQKCLRQPQFLVCLKDYLFHIKYTYIIYTVRA